MYELFILSELIEKPLNGYNLKRILQNVLGNERNVSFGMIYPQLDRLEKNGYITTSLDQTASKKTSKLNTITTSGKERFQELMVAPVTPNQNAQLTYEIKIGSFHMVSIQTQIAIMQNYIEYLSQKIATNHASKKIIKHDKPGMSHLDKEDTLETLELRLTQNQAALNWAKNKLNKIEESYNGTI